MVNINAFNCRAMLKAFLFCAMLSQLCFGQVQTDTTFSNKKNKNFKYVIAGNAIAYTGSMVGFYSLWYKNYPQSSFHFFNDNNEWLGMDKVGHAASVFYISKWNTQLYKATGMKNKNAVWWGCGSTLLFFTTIEVMDGFSSQWGFSNGDMVANVAGASALALQQYFWNDSRINFKFSFSQSPYASCNKSLLGANFPEQIFKDYNGQTYWASANMKSIFFASKKFPAWFNIAVGYGATGMLSARNIATTNNPVTCNVNGITRQRMFYISPDIDLNKIPTKSKALKTIFNVLSFIKIPAPTIEVGKRIKMFPIYF